MAILSGIHQYQRLPSANTNHTNLLKYFMLAAAVGLVLTTTLGIIMAFRFSPSKTSVICCLLAGVAVPVALLLVYR